MNTAAERTALLAAVVAVVLIVAAGLGAAFLGPAAVTVYTTALALLVLAEGLATGLRWGNTDLIKELNP